MMSARAAAGRLSMGVRMMKSAARRFAGCASLVAIVTMAAALPSFAQTPSAGLKSQLVGHWTLVSVDIDTRAPYGTDPKGSMFVDASGHFSVIVVSDGKARSIAYFGTYSVDAGDKSVTLHVDASSGGGGIDYAGHDVQRLVSLNGDQLIVQNESASGEAGGVKLTWKKVD
jgi:Lipocalin-like domain